MERKRLCNFADVMALGGWAKQHAMVIVSAIAVKSYISGNEYYNQRIIYDWNSHGIHSSKVGICKSIALNNILVTFLLFCH